MDLDPENFENWNQIQIQAKQDLDPKPWPLTDEVKCFSHQLSKMVSLSTMFLVSTLLTSSLTLYFHRSPFVCLY